MNGLKTIKSQSARCLALIYFSGPTGINWPVDNLVALFPDIEGWILKIGEPFTIENGKLYNNRINKYTSLSIDTEKYISSLYIEDHLSFLLSVLSHEKLTLTKLSKQYELRIDVTLVAYIYDDENQSPTLYIPPHLVSFLSEIGASVGFDYYCMC
jgi:hypothetical protein